ncbi:MAG TPA: hypothetical protein VMX18_02835 [Candidatus Bipolaricaulota bacterium]|nr:hypothetical protein [Candidatus Bipolaricaulota bacterium]
MLTWSKVFFVASLFVLFSSLFALVATAPAMASQPVGGLVCETRETGNGTEQICYRLRPVAPKRVAEAPTPTKPTGEKKSVEQLLDELAHR